MNNETIYALYKKNMNQDDLRRLDKLPYNVTEYLIKKVNINDEIYFKIADVPLIYKGHENLSQLIAVNFDELPSDMKSHYSNVLELTKNENNDLYSGTKIAKIKDTPKRKVLKK